MQHSGAVTSAAQLLSASPSSTFNTANFALQLQREKDGNLTRASYLNALHQLQESSLLEQDARRSEGLRGLVFNALGGGSRKASPGDTLANLQAVQSLLPGGNSLAGFGNLLAGLRNVRGETSTWSGRTGAAGAAGFSGVFGSGAS